MSSLFSSFYFQFHPWKMSSLSSWNGSSWSLSFSYGSSWSPSSSNGSSLSRDDFTLILIFWKTWTRMILPFVKWWQWQLPTLMTCSFQMRWRSWRVGRGQTLNLVIGVQDVFGTLWAILALFKSLTKFYIGGVWWLGFLSDPYH